MVGKKRKELGSRDGESKEVPKWVKVGDGSSERVDGLQEEVKQLKEVMDKIGKDIGVMTAVMRAWWVREMERGPEPRGVPFMLVEEQRKLTEAGVQVGEEVVVGEKVVGQEVEAMAVDEAGPSSSALP